MLEILQFYPQMSCAHFVSLPPHYLSLSWRDITVPVTVVGVGQNEEPLEMLSQPPVLVPVGFAVS